MQRRRRNAPSYLQKIKTKMHIFYTHNKHGPHSVQNSASHDDSDLTQCVTLYHCGSDNVPDLAALMPFLSRAMARAGVLI